MNIWKECISSGSKVSSKRVVTLVAFLLMGIGFLANLFFDFTIDHKLFETMEWIVIAGLGFTATEGFTGKSKTESKVDDGTR
jgi:hypothetical protein